MLKDKIKEKRFNFKKELKKWPESTWVNSQTRDSGHETDIT